MLKELSLYPFTNYRRVAIRQKMRFSQPPAYHFSCWSSFFVESAPVSTRICLSPFSTASLTFTRVWVCVYVSVCVTLSKMSRSWGPICGFPPEPLERATKASNYPWPSGSPSLCLPLRAPAARSGLLSPHALLSCSVCPSHVQNNPSAWLQPLIAAISETKTVFGARQSRRSVKEKGSNNTCVSVVGVWNHIALTGTTLCFKVFHLWRKVMLQNRSLRASETENSQGWWRALTGLLLLLKTDHLQAQLSLCLLHICCVSTISNKINFEITLKNAYIILHDYYVPHSL